MKKLFFTALVAVVAVGGALSVNAATYEDASGNPVVCEEPETTVSCEGLSLYYLGQPHTPANLVPQGLLIDQYRQL